MNGYEVCRVHGGKTPRGVASPKTTHGKYSKDLPTRLAGRYEESLADTELFRLNAEIALVDTRIGELVSKLDQEPFEDTLKDIKKVTKGLQKSVNSKDHKATNYLVTQLHSIVYTKQDNTKLWNEIVLLIDQRRKLIESEQKRQVSLGQMITADRALLLVSALIGVIKDHVTDRSTLHNISSDIGKLINQRDAILIDRGS